VLAARIGLVGGEGSAVLAARIGLVGGEGSAVLAARISLVLLLILVSTVDKHTSID
jgi:hypothetical protein